MTDVMSIVEFLQRNSILAVMLSFSLIVLWAYWPGNKESIERNGRIPFEEDR
jgi:cbb3-type cytochrome oxidase subunit 3